jgi:predicted nucleic acid-binding protein
MIQPAHVRARVVDITRRGASIPAAIVLDANVLYFICYSRFTPLRLAGGRMPHSYQTREYQRWRVLARRHGCHLFTSPVAMGEFIRRAEYAEWEAFWLNHPATPPGSHFDPRQCKKVRYDHATHLRTVRGQAVTDLPFIRGIVTLLSAFPSASDALDQASAEWQGSAGDFTDALLVANAKHAGIPHLLSDDVDLLTFDGITVYTANRTAVQAASAAGKLLP